MAIVGWADLTASEIQRILLVVLLAAFALGFAYPARAWRWGLAEEYSRAADFLRRFVGSPAGRTRSTVRDPWQPRH